MRPVFILKPISKPRVNPLSFYLDGGTESAQLVVTSDPQNSVFVVKLFFPMHIYVNFTVKTLIIFRVV